MSEDNDTAPIVTTNDSTPSTTPHDAKPPRRGGFGIAVLMAFAALAVSGFVFWRVHSMEQARSQTQSTLRDELRTSIDDLTRAQEQRKRDMDSLRTRIADADGINKSMREELLGLSERSRHLEDAVANLAEQRMGGRDTLAVNEVEFLLQLAQERLVLFHDAQAAADAYRLADSALVTIEDPMWTSVRQTIGAELRALEASKPAETQDALATLEHVRAELSALPLPRVPDTEPTATSRWQALITPFVRISRDDDPGKDVRDIALIRVLTELDLRVAQAALLAHDDASWQAALQRARAGIAARFDTSAAPTQAVLADLDRLAAAPMAPAIPELGSALKELRALRATRVLSRPASPAPPPPAAAPQPSVPPQSASSQNGADA
ncbi:MAG: uroporphyrinogen-III C-methyltransferase [Rhodanobacter sp.]|jgi:uroporphyrin-3 C-methyltransferase|nr:uroporphyrinogen-III C-methyltransferase [Rhodanobacter sp.]